MNEYLNEIEMEHWHEHMMLLRLFFEFISVVLMNRGTHAILRKYPVKSLSGLAACRVIGTSCLMTILTSPFIAMFTLLSINQPLMVDGFPLS